MQTKLKYLTVLNLFLCFVKYDKGKDKYCERSLSLLVSRYIGTNQNTFMIFAKLKGNPSITKYCIIMIDIYLNPNVCMKKNSNVISVREMNPWNAYFNNNTLFNMLIIFCKLINFILRLTTENK